MQNFLNEIQLAEKQIESSYQDLRTFAFQLCDEVMKNGTGSDIVIAPSLKSAVEEALKDKNALVESLNNSKSDSTTLEDSKLQVGDLKKRLDEIEKKIRELKKTLGAIAFERSQAEDADQRLKELFKGEVEKYKTISQNRNSESIFSKTIAKVKYSQYIKKQDNTFISLFNLLDSNKLLKTIKSPRSEDLINEYQKLSKKREIIKKRLKSRQNQVDNLMSNYQDDSVTILEESLKDAESSYEEACISYGLFLFDNGSKWINASTQDQLLDLMTQMLQTQRYIDSQTEYIKKCRSMLVLDDYSAIIHENEKKISSLKKEIARINDQISDIEKENLNLRQKIKKLGGLDEW